MGSAVQPSTASVVFAGDSYLAFPAIVRARHVRIFEGSAGCPIDGRGKAMALEHGDEILTVLYEADAPGGPSRVILVRTPKSALA